MMSRILYASAVESIMYTILCTRPDIAYTIGIVSRFQTNPKEDHWKAVKNILKYLRRTKDVFLVYEGLEFKLEGFTNSSFQSDPDDCKSISRYVFILNGGAVS